MVHIPSLSDFIKFHDLDPSRQGKCIYITQSGFRCGWSCQDYDNRRAIEVHQVINAISSGVVGLDLLQEYVLCNCCRSGNAQHRDRIADIHLLIPLARQWQQEIQERAVSINSDSTIEESASTPHAHTILATPSPGDTTTLDTLFESSYIYQQTPPNNPNSFSSNAIPSESVMSSPRPQNGSLGVSITTESGLQPFESQSRYDLRPREANISTNSTSSQSNFVTQLQQSEFRPHVANPLPSDSVSRKIRTPLKRRDFETGSLYIFERASSPGHVKIGWTAREVWQRLEDWSRCGYQPNPLFEVNSVPFAQRMETLTHHELINEWRRERMCKSPQCGKSHQEWFETTKERAEQVLGGWAKLSKRAELYDSRGWLTERWREVVEMMDGNGEVVTAKKLLEWYENSLVEEVEEVTLVMEPLQPLHELKIEEEDLRSEDGPKVAQLEILEETLVRVGSVRIEEPVLPKKTPLIRNTALSEQTPSVDISLYKGETKPESDPLLKTEPSGKTGKLAAADSTSKNESQPKIKPVIKSEPVHEEATASETTPVKKELMPDQTPLSPSPSLQAPAISQNTLHSREIEPNHSSEIEESFAKDVSISSDAKTTMVDNSSNTSTSLLVLPLVTAPLSTANSPSAIPSKSIPPHGNGYTSADFSASTGTNQPQLNFLDTSSRPNKSEPSATFAPPRVQPTAVPSLVVPLSTNPTEGLLSRSKDEQEESTKTTASVMQRHQKVEENEQTDPGDTIIGCDRQTREDEIKSDGQDTTPVAEEDADTEADVFDADATLVEDLQSGSSLERATLKIVDEVSNKISASAGNAELGLKGLDVLQGLERSAPPVVEVVAQA